MFPWKKWVLMIYEINHIWTAEMKWKWRNDQKLQDFNGVWTRDLAIPVRCSTNELWSHWIFFSGFFTQLHKLRSLRRSFLHFHFISAVHLWVISYIINTHFFHGNIWIHNWRQWLYSSVGRTSHRYREVTGLNPVEVLFFFQAALYAIA